MADDFGSFVCHTTSASCIKIYPMTQDIYRRLYGMTLGAALGLAFGLTAQTLNALAIPDVIFHQSPLGVERQRIDVRAGRLNYPSDLY